MNVLALQGMLVGQGQVSHGLLIDSAEPFIGTRAGNAALDEIALFSAEILREMEVGDARLTLALQSSADSSETSFTDVSETKLGDAEVSETKLGSAEISAEKPEDG